jgi:predicted NAD/FAD-dependent oxidoreductase
MQELSLSPAIKRLEDLLTAILHKVPDHLRSMYEEQTNDAINGLRAAAKATTKINLPKAAVEKRPRRK